MSPRTALDLTYVLCKSLPRNSLNKSNLAINSDVTRRWKLIHVATIGITHAESHPAECSPRFIFVSLLVLLLTRFVASVCCSNSVDARTCVSRDVGGPDAV